MQEHLIITGVIMTNCRSDGRDQRLVLQIPTGQSPAHSAAAPFRGVRGDGGQFLRRAPREQLADPFLHSKHEPAIFPAPPLGLAHAPGRPFFGVFHAFPFGLLNRPDFDENALSFVPFPAAAETDDLRKRRVGSM